MSDESSRPLSRFEESPEETLRRLNLTGDYRQAIRYQMGRDAITPSDPTTHTEAAFREVQFAVALQHAGFFSLSIDAYKSALDLAYRGSGLTQAFRNHVQIQLATLHERVGRIDEAWKLIHKMPRPETGTSLRIARMSDDDWYFLTYMKLCFRNQDFGLARLQIKELGPKPRSEHSSDWTQVFNLTLDLIDRGELGASDLLKIQEVSDRYFAYDAPGEPWIGLFVAPWVAKFDTRSAIEILERAARNAERLGKFFLVAAIYEELAVCYSDFVNREAEAQAAFTRSLNAYGKCHLLMRNPIRSRLARLGRRIGYDSEDLGRLALRSSSLLFDRSAVIFAVMCSTYGQRVGVEPFRAFELFVEEWAPTRFPGEIYVMAPGEQAADLLLVRNEGDRRVGIALQAKHYKNPKRSIPAKNPRLRDLSDKYHVDIDRYVFVVSTSSPGGWREDMWNSQTTTGLRNVITDRSIAIQVVTEPELQTDVVLNDHLLRIFFGYLTR